MNTLWNTPSPSTGFLKEAKLIQYPKRTWGLSFECEGEGNSSIVIELQFLGVVAYKCTLLPALSGELIKSSYDKLVDVGATNWLADSQAIATRTGHAPPIKHLRICFDDGPCYEFLCSDYTCASNDTNG